MTAGTIVLALCLALAPSAPDAAPALRLEIDVSALPKGPVTDGLELFMREHQGRVIEDAGLELEPDAPLTLRIRLSRYGQDDLHSRAELALVRHGEEEPSWQRNVECELCRDGELVMAVAGELEPLSTRLLYEPESITASSSAPDPAPVSVTPGEADAFEPTSQVDAAPPPTRTPPPPRGRPLGPLGIGALPPLVVGGTGLAAGIALSLRPEQVRLTPDGVDRRRTRPAGIAVASVGAALLVSGVAMLVTDLLRRRRNQPSSRFGRRRVITQLRSYEP